LEALALANGKLEEGILTFLREKGAEIRREGDRSYQIELAFGALQIPATIMSSKDMPSFVARGLYFAGICGRDHVEEFNARPGTTKLVELAELDIRPHGKWQVVLVRSKSDESSLKRIRVASEYVYLTRRYLQNIGVLANVARINGTAESQIGPGKYYNRAVCVMESGDTLNDNNQEVDDIILDEVRPVLFATQEAMEDPVKRAEIEILTVCLSK
jgi:ATP phosphoribosyltransferase